MVIFAVMAALCIGILIGMHLFQDRPVGDLRVDHSAPVDGPHLYLELDTDVSAILRKKRVAFRVKAKDFIPHE
jgi:hypothetical protein